MTVSVKMMLAIQIVYYAALVGTSIAAWAGIAAAQGDERVGLVMTVSGEVTPPTAAMAELQAGTPLHLAPGTQLTFLHYGRCKLITVFGGTLSLSRTEFATDGKILGEKDGPCPRADSDDVARSFRDHVARCSDMMSPGRGVLLTAGF